MCFLEGIRLVRAFGESRDLVFSPSRSNLGLVSSRLAGFVRNREIYNLGMVSGPVLLKIKGTCWIFMVVVVKKMTSFVLFNLFDPQKYENPTFSFYF